MQVTRLILASNDSHSSHEAGTASIPDTFGYLIDVKHAPGSVAKCRNSQAYSHVVKRNAQQLHGIGVSLLSWLPEAA